MEGGGNSRLYGGGSNGGCSSDHPTHFLQMPPPPSSSSSSSKALESIWVPNSFSSSFHEPSMVNFDVKQGRRLGGARRFRVEAEDDEEDGVGVGSGGEDEGSDFEGRRNPYRQPEKKRRLTAVQVQQLEQSFEVDNKLEPHRKIHLAKELGLQPRQVAIWFQNRRARFKTKQLERDYDSLKANYDSLKTDYDSLLKEKERLQNEVALLTDELKLRERGESSMDPLTGWMNSAQLNRFEPAEAPCKQEDVSSAKSDVVDSESPHCTDGNKPEGSGFSPETEEGEDLSHHIRPVAGYGFGKVEDAFDGELRGSCCNFGLPGVDDQDSVLVLALALLDEY